MGRSSADPKAEFSADVQLKKASATEFSPGGIETAVENPRKPLEISKFNGNKISFGRGLPNFTMKKPFSEVVAGSATTDSGFPPLQQRKQPSSGSERGMKKNKASDQSLEGVHETVDQGSQKPLQVSSVQQSLNRVSSDGSTDSDPFLRIGSNVVPMNVSNDEKAKSNPDIKHVTAYVGFEHECPHGHRFLLNPEHLNQLGVPYSLFEESQNSCPVESSDPALADSSKVGKNVGHSKVHRNTNGIIAASAPVSKMKSKGTTKQLVANGNVSKDGLTQLSMPEKDHNQTFVTVAGLPVTVKDLETGFHSVSLDDGGSSFSMLNRDLPIYMNCPHCRSARDKKIQPKVKFASSISQLQRIFLVTPPFPVVLAANPVIQFEASCLPSSVPDHEQKLQFSLGCKVILPPESFLILRLPFVYGVQLEDKSVHSLNPFEDKPERLGLAKMEIYTNDDFAEAELLTSSILLGCEIQVRTSMADKSSLIASRCFDLEFDSIDVFAGNGQPCVATMLHFIIDKVDKKAKADENVTCFQLCGWIGLDFKHDVLIFVELEKKMLEQLQNLMHAPAFAAWGTSYVTVREFMLVQMLFAEIRKGRLALNPVHNIPLFRKCN
ncbi:Smg8/Smg9 [Corchorus capsularis]|uniref:Nonsense-mediated mRNA decay factor SMG8 n=1 Tax=Corchorus capsularis TaxID=210143 RepID=A0A1R3IP75_COCAP|nr:Smg8/Smg9 [Corchorus capsularis]